MHLSIRSTAADVSGGVMPRRRREDEDFVPPSTLLGAAFQYANNQSPITLIALAALGFLGWLYMSTLAGMAKDLNQHAHESRWYQRQSCVSLAILAGTHPELCENPEGPGR